MASRCLVRREFIALLGGTAAWPWLAAAQPAAKPLRVGVLYPGLRAVLPSRVTSFRSGLQFGGLRAEQVEILERAADGNLALLVPMAADLVTRKVDLIFAISPAAIRAAKAATDRIPIVAGDLESEPASTGFFVSTARPGGNITGTYLDFPDFSKKWIEALKEVVPHVTNVAVIWDPATGPMQLKAVEAAAATFGVALTVLEVRRPSDIELAFRMAAEKRAGAMLMLSSPLVGGTTKLSAELALKHRLPAITLFTDFARNGGLMAYGPNLLAFIYQSGVIAARILLGANPADTPVETPAKFEFVLNLRTAKRLGLTIPTTVLLRADEVIE